jgi:CRISPR system Cascade subunit CasC
MNLELHILQNFAPSNLNRDDTGSPKSCDFGGYRRARISSQAIKRAIRHEFKEQDLVPPEARAVRTKRVREELVRRLTQRGKPAEEAGAAAKAALGALGIDIDSSGEKTEYLLFLGEAEVATLADFCNTHWVELHKLSAGEGRGRDAKKAARDAAAKALPKGAIDGLKTRLNGGRAADLALFGRMLADLPEKNIDAASQVAHAISTHQVNFDFDYYTAVDDLKAEDTSGADMIGTVEFNSACFYRYVNIDLGQLKKNLDGDSELVATTVRAFLYASRDAIPTGKQNAFAARNAPSFAFAVVRDSGFWSLANAFVKPVRPRGEDDLVQLSIDRLAHHWDDLASVYGNPARTSAVCALKSIAVPPPLDGARLATYEALVQRAMSAIEV